MTTIRLEAIQAELELKKKELALVMEIDHIRDTAPEPNAMLTAIVNLLADRLQADLCFLALIDRESGEIELKAVNNRGRNQLHWLIERELAEKIIVLNQVTLWTGSDVLSEATLKKIATSLYLAAVPIIMGETQHLGAILLARPDPAFDLHEAQILNTAEDQIDSAIIQVYHYYDAQQRLKELETIYRIDRIRDQSLNFDQMLDAVLQELCQIIEAEMGFVMLYDQSGRQLEMRATTHADLFNLSAYYQAVYDLAQKALADNELVYQNNLENGLNSIICLPLVLNGKGIGVIGVANRYGERSLNRGFNNADQRLLKAIGSQMDTAIFENLEKRRLRDVLDRSVGPHIMDRLLDGSGIDFLKGERSILTVLYADIRGSTSLAEVTDPELYVGFINYYLGRMTEIIIDHDATLDKFVGDEVMALFGAPVPRSDHALAAVKVGLAMQQAYHEIMEIWHERGVMAGPIGVGIATGELIVGEMGSTLRSNYTAIGRAANLGSRICNVAQGGQVLISKDTYNLVKDKVQARAIQGMQFKGVAGYQTVYDVMGLRAD